MQFPGGSKAIDTYLIESSTKKPKKQNIKALCFDAVQDTYTVSFVEAGKGKRTEKLMKTSELLKLPGGAFVIEEYKALYTHNATDLPYSAFDLCVSSFQPIIAQYTVQYRVPGTTTTLECQVNADKLKKLPGGPEAILGYINAADLPYSAFDLCVSNFQPIIAQYTVQYRVPSTTTTLECQVHADKLKKFPGGPEAILGYIKELLVQQPQVISAYNFNLIMDSYTVKMIEHGETKQIEKLMTTSELLTLPGGSSAIATYKRLTMAPMNAQVPPMMPARNLYILKFDKVIKNYTVSYNEPGKRTKIEQMRTRSELANMQGKLQYIINK